VPAENAGVCVRLLLEGIRDQMRKRRPQLRHRGRLLAFLAAIAALAGGTQALAPTPAAAMINDGEECGEPSVDCEPGGGAGGTGETVDTETIEVHGTAPSPCVLHPSPCLPSSGRPRPGSGGSANPRPRHGGRPVRVADGPQPTGWMKRCRDEERRYKRVVHRTLWFEAAQAHLVRKWRNLEGRVSLAGAKRSELKKTLDFMLSDRDSYGPSLVVGIEAEIAHSEHQLDQLEAEYRRVAASRALDPLWPLLEAESVAKETFEACRKKWEPKEPEAPYDVD
jgi:hypothetical protein